MNDADAGNDACPRSLVVVLPPSCESRELKKWRVVVGDEIDAIASHDLSPSMVSVNRLFSSVTTVDRNLLALTQGRYQLLIRHGVRRKEFA